MTQQLVDVASQLEMPFPLEAIELLPKGKLERDGKTLCMGMPYADVRVYEDRLNSLACGEWSTPPCLAVVAGTKLLTYVTVIVFGVVHTDVGESSITSENGGTEAWAQGFKRACSQFGLGRYLYDLDKEWVPYNVSRKAIDLDAAGIRNIARKMYQKAGIPIPGQANAQPATNGATTQPTAVQPTPAPADPQPANASDIPQPCELRARCKVIGKDFNTLVKMLKKSLVPDDALSPEDCTRAAVLIGQWEGFHAARERDQAKVAANGNV
jgi:hypothetical protein